MRLKVHSFPNLSQNVRFDDVLLQLAQQTGAGECLRFWESSAYGIVLGRVGKADDDINFINAKSDGIEIVRRSSGGGTVVQGPGCLNFCMILSKQKYPELNDLRRSYQWISQKIIKALLDQGIEGEFCPISDLALSVNLKKFSGNAQRRTKDYVMHHGTILYGLNLDLVSRYLNMPLDMPAYRKARHHNDFVTNIPLNALKFQHSLSAAFGITYDPQPLTPEEISSLQACPEIL